MKSPAKQYLLATIAGIIANALIIFVLDFMLAGLLSGVLTTDAAAPNWFSISLMFVNAAVLALCFWAFGVYMSRSGVKVTTKGSRLGSITCVSLFLLISAGGIVLSANGLLQQTLDVIYQVGALFFFLT